MKYFLIQLLVFLLSFSSYALHKKGNPLVLSHNTLKFVYQNFDGDLYVPCKHEVDFAPGGDWKVICEKGNFKRTYIVHLWVSAYTRDVIPRSSFEVLYWVSDKSKEKPVGTSSTIWFHLNEKTSLHSLQLSQGVDEETAGLYLTIEIGDSLM